MKNNLQTAPKGWNSWDTYGASVTETEVKNNAEVLAKRLNKFGWNYVVVDIQWYEPSASSADYHKFTPLTMDEYSRVMPATNRFPSAKDGLGFKPLAEYVHKLGLKFGIHILRGIPREAVHKHMKLLGTNLTADQIATNTICPWNTDMYGVNVDMIEGQQYYDSIVQLYASWGVDFLKVDDIAYSTIYRQGHLDEIAAIRKAIDKSGRDIVLSVSPGPAQLADGSFLQRNANMWRMTDDFWDDWSLLYDMFDRCNYWSPFVKEGSWPDCDMLPLGHIGIRSGERDLPDRMTNFTKSEQKTMMTLWSIFQSPLMFGGELTDLDDWTFNLLSNSELNKMHSSLKTKQQAYRDKNWIVWTGDSDSDHYCAIFNVSNTNQPVPEKLFKTYVANNSIELWTGKINFDIKNEVDKHGCLIFKN